MSMLEENEIGNHVTIWYESCDICSHLMCILSKMTTIVGWLYSEVAVSLKP